MLYIVFARIAFGKYYFGERNLLGHFYVFALPKRQEPSAKQILDLIEVKSVHCHHTYYKVHKGIHF